MHGTSIQITLLTEHKEGFPTAVYRVSLDRLELSSIALPCGATQLLELDGTLYLAGTDGILRKLAAQSADPVGEFGQIRGIARIGESVAVLTADALHILDGQTIALPEAATAVAANRAATWIAIGTKSGRLLSFSREESDSFEPGESAQVHQAAITRLLFDPEQFVVLSTALDKQLMMTHLRGELETAERSKKVHEEAISA
ncbi:MAG: hypothetical protein ACI8W8_003021 [Rhodothermales bacterium]